MRIGIVYSLNDIAAVGIVNELLQGMTCNKDYFSTDDVDGALLCRFNTFEVVLLEFDKEVVFLDELELKGNTDFIIIPSRHESSAHIKSFTVHTPGNPWKRSDFGGRPMCLSTSNPILKWYMLQELYRLKQHYPTLASFSVSYEVTHHGPTTPSKSVTFIEIGGSEKEWSNAEAHRIVASAIKGALTHFIKDQDTRPCIVSVGFGGNHYASLFTKRAFEKNECYGHMVPNYVIKELTLEDLKIVAEMAIQLTPGARRVVIEKMRSELKNVIVHTARSFGLEVITV